MAIHSLTVKQIISRVKQVFPEAPEVYIMSLVNDAVNELGQYSQKAMSAKIDIVSGQMYYSISDSAEDSSSNQMGINKIYRVSSNSIICNKSDFYKLKSGKVVDVEKKSAEQLLNLGVVEKVNTKQNKESK